MEKRNLNNCLEKCNCKIKEYKRTEGNITLTSHIFHASAPHVF